MVRAFIKNKNNKIEFTEAELNNLLNEAYKEGYNNGRYYNWYLPPFDWSPYYIAEQNNEYIAEIKNNGLYYSGLDYKENEK